MLLKNQNGERQWMMKLKPLKETTLGSYLIFQRDIKPLGLQTKLKENGEVDKYKARLVARDISKNMGSTIKKFLLQLQDMIQLDW